MGAAAGILGTRASRRGLIGLGQIKTGLQTTSDIAITNVAVAQGDEKLAMFPWGVKAPETERMQRETNVLLVQKAYRPIDVDGVLGAATCGARKELGLVYPATCRDFTPPTKMVESEKPPERPSLPGPGPDVELPPAPEPPGVSKASMLGGALALSAVAVGGYYYGKKKGWFK